MSEKESLNFEEALTRLGVIVEKLDDDSLSLEDSINLYEEGITLSKQCTKTLEQAELRIEQVTEDDSQST